MCATHPRMLYALLPIIVPELIWARLDFPVPPAEADTALNYIYHLLMDHGNDSPTVSSSDSALLRVDA